MFSVYSIDYSDYNLELYGNYGSNNEADVCLYKTVIEFIEDEEGKKNAKIHKDNPKEDYNELVKSIKEGYFLNNEDGKIILYLRKRLDNVGYIYSSIDVLTERVRFYGIKGDNQRELEENVCKVNVSNKVSDETVNNYDILMKELKGTLKNKK
jgi:hypothetical protein